MQLSSDDCLQYRCETPENGLKYFLKSSLYNFTSYWWKLLLYNKNIFLWVKESVHDLKYRLDNQNAIQFWLLIRNGIFQLLRTEKRVFWSSSSSIFFREDINAITYDKRPNLKKDAWQKSSLFFKKKDFFLSCNSLQFQPFIIPYGFWGSLEFLGVLQ